MCDSNGPDDFIAFYEFIMNYVLVMIFHFDTSAVSCFKTLQIIALWFFLLATVIGKLFTVIIKVVGEIVKISTVE